MVTGGGGLSFHSPTALMGDTESLTRDVPRLLGEMALFLGSSQAAGGRTAPITGFDGEATSLLGSPDSAVPTPDGVRSNFCPGGDSNLLGEIVPCPQRILQSDGGDPRAEVGVQPRALRELPV